MHQLIPNYAKGLKCLKCSNIIINLQAGQLIRYLMSELEPCPHCNTHLNLFNIISNCIEENFFFTDVFEFVNANTSIIQFTLKPASVITITFEEYGIPKGSRILQINYTPEMGGLYPLEWHGNTPFRLAPRDFVTLYPAQFCDSTPSDTKVNMMITWIESGSLEDASLRSLVDAFQEYSLQDFDTCIVPANTAIEFDTMQYIENALEAVSSKNNIKEFFKGGVSYVPSLKIVIPLIAKTKNFPTMPEQLLTSLVTLASLRNQIAHTGKTKAPLSKEQVAKCLSGVILGKWYIRELRKI